MRATRLRQASCRREKPRARIIQLGRVGLPTAGIASGNQDFSVGQQGGRMETARHQHAPGCGECSSSRIIQFSRSHHAPSSRIATGHQDFPIVQQRRRVSDASIPHRTRREDERGCTNCDRDRDCAGCANRAVVHLNRKAVGPQIVGGWRIGNGAVRRDVRAAGHRGRVGDNQTAVAWSHILRPGQSLATIRVADMKQILDVGGRGVRRQIQRGFHSDEARSAVNDVDRNRALRIASEVVHPHREAI